MKKGIYFFIIILTLFSLAGCSIEDRVNNAKVTIGKSEKFSEEEIKEAIECTKENFKSFDGCTLTDIWYDEEKSNKLTQDHLEYGGGYEVGNTDENTIVLMSNFDVGSSGGDGSLEPNSTYTDWQWDLVRDSKSEKWKVVSWGY
ncbi:DUF4829 domain-containing protein [Romboutsia lituseburensis]|uniref:DUF4829 domain-containing protein n=1 Tax=Romboutsia lituseburensis TaxID=1537 RepID=UPI00215A73DE|nr:DUF4829 domain-containing protein [Romboutsia lituseburensis]MCR8746941.1 DUF4829 domain-containing protein [Romboutsia lituseburensis]